MNCHCLLRESSGMQRTEDSSKVTFLPTRARSGVNTWANAPKREPPKDGRTSTNTGQGHGQTPQGDVEGRSLPSWIMEHGNATHLSDLQQNRLGANRSNISRCCRDNQSRRKLKDTLGRPSNKVNTDHKHMGIRFYFENDNIWTTKINL